MVVLTGSETTIYQLKHFTDRIPARSPKRRAQVEKSLCEAAKHEPTRWVLVVPMRLNQKEHDWFDGLRRSVNFDVSLWDVTALNDVLADHPQVGVLLMQQDSDYLLEAVKVYSAEKAVLAAGLNDFDERLRHLVSLNDAQDLNWRWALQRRGDQNLYVLTPQHPHAVEVSPITLNLELDFEQDEDGEALRDRWISTLRYGAPGRVELPPAVVQRFDVDGPPLVAGQRSDGGVAIEALSLDAPRRPVRLRVLAPPTAPSFTNSSAGPSEWPAVAPEPTSPPR